jgi:hypothetical protein
MFSRTESVRCNNTRTAYRIREEGSRSAERHASLRRKGSRACACTGAYTSNDWTSRQSLRASLCRSKERHDATQPAKMILQLSHRARKEGCPKASWATNVWQGWECKICKPGRKIYDASASWNLKSLSSATITGLPCIMITGPRLARTS